MKYKCLLLDHDDTSVQSTSAIHYPAHIETMRKLRPGQQVVSLNEWFKKNFDPGVMEFFTGELGFTDEEIKIEYNIWRSFNENAAPGFFPGIIELIKEFQDSGGIIAVVSHSEAEHIARHYEVRGEGCRPDIIFGWDHDKNKRKPSPWPVEQIIERYDLSREEMLMVDDLKPGLEMAKNSGIDIAGAGWGHSVPEIEKHMRLHCSYYFSTVAGLADFLFN